MHRCFDLARLGAGRVSPNPLVGAVLVNKDRIIGEGWHEQYGHAHAEVNAVKNVAPEDEALISSSTLYVSLEPCCIHGNTPPCSQLIMDLKIPKVVISCLDFTPGVAGNSVQLLREHGIEVITGILEEEGKYLSRFRNTFVRKQRPYIFLKYAQSADGFMGKIDEQVWLTNSISKRLVHKWRSEFDAILVGTNTARIDNPRLTNRLYFGGSPLRLVIDKKLSLSPNLHLYDDSQATLFLTKNPISADGFERTHFVPLPFEEQPLETLMNMLYENKVTSLIVEGGASTLQHFIDLGLWDEAAVFKVDNYIKNGIPAPILSGKKVRETMILRDRLSYFVNA